MRGIWGAMLVSAACSSPATNEALPAGPPRTPRPCKDADLVAAMSAKASDAAARRQHDVLVDFAAAQHVTLDASDLPVLAPQFEMGWRAPSTVALADLPPADATMTAIERAWVAHPRDDDFELDLSGPGSWQMLVVDVRFIDHDGCGDTPSAEYHLAHRADGAPVVLRERIVRRETSQVEECGTCRVGCGIPGVSMQWIAFALPVASRTTVPMFDVEADLDELRVRCEREVPAE